MPANLTFTGRLILSLVFAVAGGAKLRGMSSFRDGLLEFGVPSRFTGPLGVTLVAAELLVAAALLLDPTAWIGAIGAGGLLVAFSAAIAVALLVDARS